MFLLLYVHLYTINYVSELNSMERTQERIICIFNALPDQSG